MIEGLIFGEDDPNATFTGQLFKSLTDLTGWINDWAVNDMSRSAQNWYNDLADNSVLAQKAAELAVTAMSALPYIAALYLTKGASSTTGTMVTSAAGTPVLTGTGSAAVNSLVYNSMQQMAADPTWKISFAKSYGNAYNQAKADGASEGEAIAAATVIGAFNACTGSSGSGGNVQSTINYQDAGKILQSLTQAMNDGVMNSLQSVGENAVEKIVYDDDKAWFSVSDPDAVFSLSRGVSDIIEGMIASGTQSAVSEAVDGIKSRPSANAPSSYNWNDAETGANIKSAGVAYELLEQALELPAESSVHEMAASMLDRIDVALLELGLDNSEVYHMSPKEQVQMISHITDSVLDDQELGQLARMVFSMQ